MPVVQLQMLPWHLYTEVHCFEVHEAITAKACLICCFWMQLPVRKQDHLDQRDERHASGHARSIPMEDHLMAHSVTILQLQTVTAWYNSAVGQYELYMGLLVIVWISRAA